MGQAIDVKAMAEKMGNEAAIAALAPQMNGMEQMLAPYLPDAKTRYDMPALLTVAAGYEFLSNLRATVEYHFFDDKNAKMANNRQEKLTHGTHEILAGVEWDINKMFTVSCGGQRTDYGLSDEFQQNTSFACDSYSIGFGGAMNVTEKLRINASFFWTMYSDYTHKQATRTDTYSRTNNVFGMGVDYKF
jgi:long-chain fatty acid transport protein